MFATRQTYALDIHNVNQVPNRHGVYWLYWRGRLIYIGRAAGFAVSVRSRLHDHMAGREGRCTQVADMFAYEICLNPVARERSLLDGHKRLYGCLPACNDRIG